MWQYKSKIVIFFIGVAVLVLVTLIAYLFLVPGKIRDYQVIKGAVKEIAAPPLWQNQAIHKTLQSLQPGSEITLPDYSRVILDGTIAMKNTPRYYWVIEGKAVFQVQHRQSPFIVLTRTATIEVMGTDFVVTTKEMPAVNPKKARPGENAAQLSLQVQTGKVKVRPAWRKRAQVIKAGQDIQFTLGQVYHQGKIQSLGFGLSTRKGPVGKLMRKRAAKISAIRGLSEFMVGIRFDVDLAKDKTAWPSRAQLQTQANISLQDGKFEYQQLTDKILLCRAMITAPRTKAVSRRNCKKRDGQSTTPVKLHKNLVMAAVSARNNAILKIVRDAADDYYGVSMPAKLVGTFYPASFQVQIKKEHAIAIISGEVLFD